MLINLSLIKKNDLPFSCVVMNIISCFFLYLWDLRGSYREGHFLAEQFTGVSYGLWVKFVCG